MHRRCTRPVGGGGSQAVLEIETITIAEESLWQRRVNTEIGSILAL